MASTDGERQPTVTISQDTVILVYQEDGTLYKRLYPYGDADWEAIEVLVPGEYPDVVVQGSKLWLLWTDAGKIYYANSYDGGRTLTVPAILINGVTIPGAATLSNGFLGVACLNVNTIVYTTEVDGFILQIPIAVTTVTPLGIVSCSHEDRVFVGWVDAETAKYSYSDDNGVTWSTVSTLGTYTGISFLDLPTGHLLAR